MFKYSILIVFFILIAIGSHQRQNLFQCQPSDQLSSTLSFADRVDGKLTRATQSDCFDASADQTIVSKFFLLKKKINKVNVMKTAQAHIFLFIANFIFYL